MADWISGALVVLGTLMVLAGACLIVLRTLGMVSSGAAAPAADELAAEPGRRLPLHRLTPATQLIAWGVVLLVLSALTVGLISFGVSFEVATG